MVGGKGKPLIFPDGSKVTVSSAYTAAELDRVRRRQKNADPEHLLPTGST